MRTFENVLEAIGRTPMVRLNKVVPSGSANVYAKCEFLNPGGSIKDRMAYHIVRKAMERGDLAPGGVIVENTSGNTGMGLALIASVFGLRIILTMPDKMSQEKIDMLRAFGAKVVVTPTEVPADSPDSYYETAKRLAREVPESFYVNQYHNKDNIEAHYLSTGPEVWEDMGGKVDAVVIGVGTGGTISGVGKYIKEKNPGVRVIGVDPIGSIYYDLFKSGKMTEPHVYKVEGIGEDMVCGALDFSVIDDMVQVNDKECFTIGRRLAREEGIYAGGSSGAAVAGALKVAAEMGPGKNVVCILPDSGNRYLSKMFNDEWMRVNGFMGDEGDLTAGMLAQRKGGNVIWLSMESTLGEAGHLLHQNDVSQAPVRNAAGALVGMVTESCLLSGLVSGRPLTAPVTQVMQKKPPVVAPTTPVARITELLLGQAAVLVGTCETVECITGVLTKIDLIDR